MTQQSFTDIVTSEEQLRELIGTPGDGAIRKQLSSLDQHCRTFISSSPFVLIGSVNSAGNHDVSPRGDAPGFVLVLSEKTLVIPERPGNRRLDTLRNILQTSTVGLLFLIPGWKRRCASTVVHALSGIHLSSNALSSRESSP